MTVITYQDLDAAVCSTPGCDCEGKNGFFLHAKCHPEMPTWVHYKDKIVTVTCGICDRKILTIDVTNSLMYEGGEADAVSENNETY